MSDLRELFERVEGKLPEDSAPGYYDIPAVRYNPDWRSPPRDPTPIRTLQPIKPRSRQPWTGRRRHLLIDALVCVVIVAAVAIAMWMKS